MSALPLGNEFTEHFHMDAHTNINHVIHVIHCIEYRVDIRYYHLGYYYLGYYYLGCPSKAFSFKLK